MPDDYLRFNSNSISTLIQEKLENGGYNVSRASSTSLLTEVVSQVFELLLYQLNRTASQSTFSKSTDLESIISQAKLLGYKPRGYQSGSAFFDLSLTANLANQTFTIPRYSFIQTSNGRYSLTQDITFANEFTVGDIVSENTLLRSGSYVQHPALTATNIQKITLSLGDNRVDHDSIDVYVRSPSGSWEQWSQVNSLFLSGGSDKDFEISYTGSGYTLQFGDCVNGLSPEVGSDIQIYYLSTPSSTNLVVGEAASPLTRFSTTIFDTIISDLSIGAKGVYINDLKSFFSGVNTTDSSAITLPETVDEIRINAPNNFQTQNRLVTSQDYQSFITNNYSQFVGDVIVMDNQEYLDTYMNYYHDQGLNNPLLESRSLYNQINFADSVNYNNIYFFVVPKKGNYLTDVQKAVIIEGVSDLKTLTSELCPADPIYINYALAIPETTLDFEDISNSSLRVVRSTTTNRSQADIQQEVYSTIVNYFSERASTFGNLIDVNQLNTNVLNIDGVQETYTVNNGVEIRGVNFYSYNPQFNNVTSAPPTSQFEKIFVPRFFDNGLLGRISVE